MQDFQNLFDQLTQEQALLNQKKKEAKSEAIKVILNMMKNLDITLEDLGGISATTRKRGPLKIKYRTPTGIEWSGQGLMKKELKEYLEENGLTLEDVKVD